MDRGPCNLHAGKHPALRRHPPHHLFNVALPSNGDLAAVNIIPVTKSDVFIDLTADTLLPNGKQVKKWEGITIGPRPKNGAHVIITGNDNDYVADLFIASSPLSQSCSG